MIMNNLIRVFLIIICVFPYQINAQVDEGIEPYVSFLKDKKNISAKDYILSLFEKNNLVILCERDHREMLQYDLILDIIQDPYFVENIGNVYTEIGGRCIEAELNSFLQNSNMLESEVDKKVLHFQRNCMFPLWEKPNYSKFIKGVHLINKNLPDNRKVRLFPTDVICINGEATENKVVEMIKNMIIRDSLMANYIEEKLSPGSKALVIMNYRHAYRYDMTNEYGYTSDNVGRFLFEKYPGKIANILINSYNNPEEYKPVNDGKWDAAFQALEIENIGFNFEQSPFGKDQFEGWAKNTYSYEDIFTGFVFYLPIEKFKLGMGVNHLMEDGFYDEYIKREKLYHHGMCKLRNIEEPSPMIDKNEIMILNETKISSLHTLDQVKASIQKWLLK